MADRATLVVSADELAVGRQLKSNLSDTLPTVQIEVVQSATTFGLIQYQQPRRLETGFAQGNIAGKLFNSI